MDEILDGFTLQGGDVQVAFRTEGPTPFPASGRVSNCIFDMRHGYPSGGAGSSSVDGPYLGLLMEKLYVNVNTGVCGYFEQRVHLVNNTFVMSEYAGGWTHDARSWRCSGLHWTGWVPCPTPRWRIAAREGSFSAAWWSRGSTR